MVHSGRGSGVMRAGEAGCVLVEGRACVVGGPVGVRLVVSGLPCYTHEIQSDRNKTDGGFNGTL